MAKIDKNMELRYEELEEYDYLDSNNLDKVVNNYGLQVGKFLIKFSCLEHELDITIADSFSAGYGHKLGYIVTKNFSMSSKIELLSKMQLAFDVTIEDELFLEKIQKKLKIINEFRNDIVHAKWQTLSKDGYVRTKIRIDNMVKFRKVKIIPSFIKQKIQEIDKLIKQIINYREKLSIDC